MKFFINILRKFNDRIYTLIKIRLFYLNKFKLKNLRLFQINGLLTILLFEYSELNLSINVYLIFVLIML